MEKSGKSSGWFGRILAIGHLLAVVMGLAVLGSLCGCEENEPECDAQGRFLSELLLPNEEWRAAGDERWIDPAGCGSSTEFITRLAHRRGIVATELPSWVADWEVVPRPSAGESAPLAFRRLKDKKNGVAVLRRGRIVDVLTAEDFRKELKNLFGAAEGQTVGNGL